MGPIMYGPNELAPWWVPTTGAGMAWWSESIPHRLVIEADGAKFVQVNPQ